MAAMDIAPTPVHSPAFQGEYSRTVAFNAMMDDDPEDDADRTVRYLQYDCTYKHCKYKNPLWTWGRLVKEDYNHFVELMSKHVPLESKTFKALQGELLPPDLNIAKKTVRFIDEPVQKQAQKERYLKLLCTHNGRMRNKSWGEVLEKDYNYFLWAVGNTMGRDTRTFDTFLDCLKEEDRLMVLKTPKGKVTITKVKKS